MQLSRPHIFKVYVVVHVIKLRLGLLGWLVELSEQVEPVLNVLGGFSLLVPCHRIYLIHLVCRAFKLVLLLLDLHLDVGVSLAARALRGGRGRLELIILIFIHRHCLIGLHVSAR